jgi:hypothetical protein
MGGIRNLTFFSLLTILLYLPAASLAITIEEFMAKYPDAAVALSATYYSNNVEKPVGSSGLRSNDPYSLDKGNVVPLEQLYNSGMLSEETLHELVFRADTSIDLVSSPITRGDTSLDPQGYSKAFHTQEQILIPTEKGYMIINGLFGGYYDGFTISELEAMGPAFLLQLSIDPVTRSDSVTDGASRVNGIDPTPPPYGDGR